VDVAACSGARPNHRYWARIFGGMREWLNPEGASEAELKKRALTDLYNDHPTWLENAHKRVGETVFAAYGWPPNPSDEEILQNLLTLHRKSW
jgi:hypothetical protein